MKKAENQNAVIVSIAGRLFVKDIWQNKWTEPIRFRQYWPTGLYSDEFSYLIGKELEYVGYGRYRTTGNTYSSLLIELECGGQTKPTFIDEEVIKKPKRAKEWRDGAWR